jgi:hypothetical protein
MSAPSTSLGVLHGGLSDDERVGRHVMKKSDLYSSLLKSCDELRGGMAEAWA